MRNACCLSRGVAGLVVILLLASPQAARTQGLNTNTSAGTEAGRLISVDAGAVSEDRGPETQATTAGEGLRFNFRNVPLDAVLDYLGKAAGLVIVREVSVEGRIDAVSHRALNRQEAVELLNAVLTPKGYAAIRNENTLNIVKLEDARKRDSPVRVGRDSAKIPKTAVMVTQIIPVRYAQAAQLIKNLEALLPAYAAITVNEGSNALVLTATQTDIRRMVQIVEALDTSASALSSIRVFKLEHADATEMAKMVTDLFKQSTGGTAGSGSADNRQEMPMPMMMGPPGMPGEDNGGGNSAEESGGRKPVVQVTAVADTRSNAVVVGAPEELLPGIERLLRQMDVDRTLVHEIRIFPLRYADAATMAQLISEVYQDSGSGNGNSSASQGEAMRGFMMGGPPGMMGGFPGESAGGAVAKAAADDVPLVTADIRTNAVVVNAGKEMMEQIAALVVRLDKSHAKVKKVFVYPLKYADPQKTAQVLQSMFSESGSGSGASSSLTSGQGGIFNNDNNDNANANDSGANSGRGGGGGGSVPQGLQMGM